MRIITWNINSVRIRMHIIERLIKEQNPDILCLQEIKCLEDQFPLKAFQQLGYNHMAIRGYKGYHGVATLSRFPIENKEALIHSTLDDGRHIGAQVVTPKGNLVHVDNYYVPAGGDIPDRDENPKFAHKLDFVSAMEAHFHEVKGIEKRVLVGDLNIAPHENDVWSHKQLLKVVSHTPIEVEKFNKMQAALPWDDAVRCKIPTQEKLYSWWSYRNRDWRKSNRGRRLDHVFTTPALTQHLKNITVVSETRDWEKTSDHVPIIADFDV